MATIELPSFSGKETWKKARLLLWSLIATVAILDFFNVIVIPEYFAGFTMLTYLIAGWVFFYNLFDSMRK